MRLDTGLCLSTYSTVFLAGACLTYAEEHYFPGMTIIAIILGILQVTAYLADGNWSLSARGANGFGLLISVGWVGWMILVFTEFDDPLDRPPWSVVILPYLGPLLMVLLLVKLFRPKGIRDYLYLHGIGLSEVALGSGLV